MSTPVITDDRIKESSGLAWSTRTPHSMWTVIDEDGYIFRLNTKAKVTAWFRLSGIRTVDTECVAMFDDYLHIGDTGDNDLKRDHFSVYRLHEPVGNGNLGKLAATRHDFTYPDGNPKNTEAMMFRPSSSSLYFGTKAKGHGQLYRHRGPLIKRQELQKVSGVQLPAYMTEGEFSNSGKTLICRSKEERSRVLLLDATKNYRLAKSLSVPKMSQPESLTVEQPAGDAFWIGSEGNDSPLVRVPLAQLYR